MNCYKTDPNCLRHFRCQSSPSRSISKVLLDVINSSKTHFSILVFYIPKLQYPIPLTTSPATLVYEHTPREAVWRLPHLIRLYLSGDSTPRHSYPCRSPTISSGLIAWILFPQQICSLRDIHITTSAMIFSYFVLPYCTGGLYT